MSWTISAAIAPRRLVELVGPAPVIGHRLAAELAGHRLSSGRFEIGIVDQEDRDLAFEVDALEVVPAALRRIHAVSNEHHRRAGDLRPVGVADGAEIDVVGEAQRKRPAALLHRECHRRLQLGPDHRDRLGPAAILAARLEPRRSKLLGQISDRLLLARTAHRPSLEFVRCEHPSDLGHAFGADLDDGCRYFWGTVVIGRQKWRGSRCAGAQNQCEQR